MRFKKKARVGRAGVGLALLIKAGNMFQVFQLLCLEPERLRWFTPDVI